MEASAPVPPKSILLVDSDERSQRVLAVSLKKAGFDVTTATSAEGALDMARMAPPDLVLSETKLPGQTGYDLCMQLKADPSTKRCSFAFLSEDTSAQARIQGINAGADDYLSKPIFVKEIVARIQSLIDRRDNEALAHQKQMGNFSGELSGMGLVDLFQLMEVGRKTGVLKLRSDPRRSGGFVGKPNTDAAIYFVNGSIVDAEVEGLTGKDAVYRLLMWPDGGFIMELGPIERAKKIHEGTQALLLEGMRRVDEWSRIENKLPQLQSHLDVDYKRLRDLVERMPEPVQELLRLFDGKRSILEVVTESDLDDLSALQAIDRLLDEGILLETEVRKSIPPPSGLTLVDWLSSAPQRRPSLEETIPNLPSALGRAVIPSPHTASEIMTAAELGRASSSAIPPGSTSSMLMRQTVRADQPIPLTRPRVPEAEHPDEPILLGQDSAPRLAKRTVSGPSAPSRQSSVPAEPAPRVPTAPPRYSSSSNLTPASPQSTAIPEPVDSERPAPWPPAQPAPRGSSAPTLPGTRAAPAYAPRPAPTPVAPSPAPPVEPRPISVPRRDSIEPSVPGLSKWHAEDHEPLPPTGQRDSGTTFALVVGAVISIVFLSVMILGRKDEAQPDPIPPIASAGQKPIAKATTPPAAKASAAWPEIPEEALAVSGTVTEAAPEGDLPPPALVEPPKPVPDPSAPKSQAELDKQLDEGTQALRKDQYSRAKRAFDKALALDEKNPTAHAGLGMAWYGLVKDSQAKSSAEKAIELDANNALAHLVLGLVASNRSDKATARREFDKYLELEPKGFYADGVRSFLKAL